MARTLSRPRKRSTARKFGRAAVVDYKGSGLVVKLPRARVAELVASGVGRPFAPAGRIFKEWLAVPRPDRRRWRALLREGVAFVGR